MFNQNNNSVFWRNEHQQIEKIFITLYKPLCFYAGRIVGEVDAEDIVVDCFCKFLNVRLTFNSMSTIKPFMYTIVRNKCIDHLRTCSRHSKSHKELSYLIDMTEEEISIEIYRAEALSQIMRSMEDLPGQQRKIFKLHFLDNLDTEKIAQMLGLKERTVINQKNNALVALRVVLGKKGLLIFCIAILVLLLF
jgi:RNA polymerase sigma factor (sigma-70 family)